MCFDFYIKRTRREPRQIQTGPAPTDLYKWVAELTCYSATAHFETMEKAKLYAQKYSGPALVWDNEVPGYWCAKYGDAEFCITKTDGHIEPELQIEYPTNFRERSEQ